MPTSTKIDPGQKMNQDRMNRNKMNRLQRVQKLPERGGVGDWVLMREPREVNGDTIDIDVAYAWVDGEWVPLGTFPDEAPVREYLAKLV